MYTRTILCALLFSSVFSPFAVHAQIPFGGPITGYYPVCQSGPGQIIGTGIQLGPPIPIALMYMFGASQSFLFGPPRGPGQFLLGMAGGFAPCMIWVPCGFTICPVPNPSHPGGTIILFHGSSA